MQFYSTAEEEKLPAAERLSITFSVNKVIRVLYVFMVMSFWKYSNNLIGLIWTCICVIKCV